MKDDKELINTIYITNTSSELKKSMAILFKEVWGELSHEYDSRPELLIPINRQFEKFLFFLKGVSPLYPKRNKDKDGFTLLNVDSIDPLELGLLLFYPFILNEINEFNFFSSFGEMGVQNCMDLYLSYGLRVRPLLFSVHPEFLPVDNISFDFNELDKWGKFEFNRKRKTDYSKSDFTYIFNTFRYECLLSRSKFLSIKRSIIFHVPEDYKNILKGFAPGFNTYVKFKNRYINCQKIPMKERFMFYLYMYVLIGIIPRNTFDSKFKQFTGISLSAFESLYVNCDSEEENDKFDN